MLAALMLRFAGAEELHRGGELRLVSMDDYGHLRRSVATVRDFPRVPTFDPYLRHPEGGIWIWPPGFELLVATPSRLFLGPDASAPAVAAWAAFLPPVLATLTLWPLFAFTRRLAGPEAGLVACGFYAVLPVAILWSGYGHLDQHAAEALVFCLTLAAAARMIDEGGGALRDVAWTGAVVGAGVLTWQGFVFVAPVLGAAAFVEKRRAPATAGGLAVAGLLVLPFALARPWPMTYISFGLFQPAFLFLCAGIVALVAVPGRGRILALAAGAVALAAWSPLRGAALHLVSGGAAEMGELGYRIYPGAWLGLIGEYQPLAGLGWGGVLTRFSPGILALIPVLLGVARARWRGRLAGVATLWVVATATVGGMTLAQRRYGYYLAAMIAVGMGVGLLFVYRRRGRASALGAAALLLVPTIPAWSGILHPVGAAGPDVLATLEALAELDPSPGDPFDPGSVEPGEVPGVLPPWSLGHLVTFSTGRPSVADNLGYGFLEQAAVFTAPPGADGEVEELLRRLRVRYLITTDLRPVLRRYAAAVGREEVPKEEMLAVRIHESFGPRVVPFLEPVLVSRTGLPNEQGTLVPRLRVFRVMPGE